MPILILLFISLMASLITIPPKADHPSPPIMFQIDPENADAQLCDDNKVKDLSPPSLLLLKQR